MKKHHLSPARQRRFLAALADTGNVSRAVALAGTSRTRVYMLRRDDPDFRQAWDEAEEIACGRLEAEAWRRAVDGFDEPLVSGGRLVCDGDGNPLLLRRYSDTLLIALLKAHRPQKFDRRAAAGLGNAMIGGAAGLDIRAMLLAKLAQAAAAQADPEPAPPLLDHAPQQELAREWAPEPTEEPAEKPQEEPA